MARAPKQPPPAPSPPTQPQQPPIAPTFAPTFAPPMPPPRHGEDEDERGGLHDQIIDAQAGVIRAQLALIRHYEELLDLDEEHHPHPH